MVKLEALLCCMIFFACSSQLHAAAKSSTGSIAFDSNRDSNHEMILHSTGLGIGMSPSSNLSILGDSDISHEVCIGGVRGSSNLYIHGALAFPGLITSSSMTIEDHASVIFADSSSANIDITFPNPASCPGRQYRVISVCETGNVTLSSNVPIDYNTSHISLASFGNAKLMASDNTWLLLSCRDASRETSPPKFSSNCLVWYDGADSASVTVDASANVTQWNDKSGNDYHLTSIGSKHPTYSSHWTNGRGALNFTRDDFQYLTFSALPIRGSMTFFVVAQMSSGGSNDGTSSLISIDGHGDNTSNRIYEISCYNGDSVLKFNDQNVGSSTVFGAALSPGLNSPYLSLMVRNKSNETLGAQLNEQALQESSHIGSAGNTTAATTSTIYVGMQKAKNARYHYGYIGEIIIYNKILNDLETTAIRNYLMEKWGL